ncbi:MAG: hypothetical protein ABUS48_02100 [Pseudomonadota bacterium]
MTELSPQKQLDGFIDKFSPEVARQTRAALKKMRVRLPGATQLVYDNYNALAIGFGPSETTSEAVFSIAVYPRWVSLFFLDGAKLKDPKKRLKGAGNVVRHVVLADIALLDDPDIVALMDQALKRAGVTLGGPARGKLVIKSISPKQRPRRP